MTNAVRFFAAALKRPGADATLQEQAYRFATKRKDTDLLVQLARYRELDPSIERELIKGSDLAVLQAWATRPDQDLDTVVQRFRSEKRVTLLQNLAQATGLPEALYEDLASRGSVQLAWKLVANDSVPDALREQVATFLGAHSKSSDRRVYTEIEILRDAGVAYLAAFARACPNPYALEALITSLAGPMSEVSVVGVQRLAEVVRTTDSHNGDVRRDAARRLLTVAHRVDEQSTLRALVEATAWITEEPYASDDSDTPVRNYLRDARSLAEARAEVDIATALEPIREATSPAAIVALVNSTRSKLQSLGFYLSPYEVAPYVLDNPHADANVVREYRTSISREQCDAIAARAIAAGDRDLAILAMDQSTFFGYGDLVRKHYNDSEDKDGFLRWLVGDDSMPPSCVAKSAVVSEDRELAFQFLPLAAVLGYDGVQDVVAEAFGNDEHAWDTFLTLADEWTGTLPDLVATVKSVST